MAATKNYNLAITHPALSKEWHPSKNKPLEPTNVTPGKNKKVWWICEKKHEWEADISNRVILGRGCPYCAGKKVSPENSFALIKPNLVSEWHPTKNGVLTPYEITIKSNKKVWWRCPKGKNHEWKTRVSDRTRGRGCPFCVGKRPSEENNLAVTHPQLIKEWHSTKNGKHTPFDFTYGSDKKIWWICPKGHDWEATISNTPLRR